MQVPFPKQSELRALWRAEAVDLAVDLPDDCAEGAPVSGTGVILDIQRRLNMRGEPWVVLKVDFGPRAYPCLVFPKILRGARQAPLSTGTAVRILARASLRPTAAVTLHVVEWHIAEAT